MRERNRRGEGERLRADIVAAAERLLATQPVESLSLRAVAREVESPRPRCICTSRTVESWCGRCWSASSAP